MSSTTAFLAGAAAMWLLICASMTSSYLRRVRQRAVRFSWSTLLVMATGGAIGIVAFALHTLTEDDTA